MAKEKIDKDKNKNCPMSFNDPNSQLLCLKGECAWWREYGEGGNCCIYDITYYLQEIANGIFNIRLHK